MKFSAVLGLTTLSALFASPAGAETFVDGTFNLSDYTITRNVQTGASANITQIATGGNPGTALSADFTTPSFSTTEIGSAYYLNNNFTYNTATSGALSTITFSIDKNVHLVPSPGTNFGNGQTFVISQVGNYYIDAVVVPAVQGVWETASLMAGASDFSLITNLATGALDSTMHPSFATGMLTFGFRDGYVFDPQIAGEAVILQDNFSVTATPAVAAVPEPETYALLLAGLGWLGALAWAARGKQESTPPMQP